MMDSVRRLVCHVRRSRKPPNGSDAISASASGSGDWRAGLCLPAYCAFCHGPCASGSRMRVLATTAAGRWPQKLPKDLRSPDSRHPHFHSGAHCYVPPPRNAPSSQTSKRSSILRVIFPYIHSIKHPVIGTESRRLLNIIYSSKTTIQSLE